MKPQITFLILLTGIAVKAQNIDTEFRYLDSTNQGVEIQNSFPKVGLTYTDRTGITNSYIVFWTRIVNHSDNTLVLVINFPTDSFTVPDAPDTHFKLLVPSDEMTAGKESLFNYGLDVPSILGENMQLPTGLQKDIKPKATYAFYVVALFNKGINGVVRAKFEAQGPDLSYTITGKEINAGQLVFKN